jgi:5-formyltetrahydrofolate cyclo-ligase
MPDFSDEAEKPRPSKVALRSRLLAARRTLTISAQCKAAASIQSVVLSWVRTHQPVTITAYVPIGSEPGGPDLPSALHGALPPGGRLLLPVLLNDGDLDWAAFEPIGSPTPLTPGRLGLQEPTGPRLGVDAIRQASLVIVPALAVDPSGHRLGRGGGSYDRALARVSPRTLTVALLHDGELIDAVPAEPHDRHVAATITPRHGLVLSRGAEWTN